MAKLVPDAIMDEMLNYIRRTCTGISVCSTQPTTYTQAYTTYRLAQVNGLTSTKLTLTSGSPTGRKVVMPANNSLSVVATGTAQHVAWYGSTGSVLLLVTTCTSQALTTGNTVNVPTHAYSINDVT